MGMSMGMMGALGGAGQALQGEAAVMLRDEDRAKEDASRKSFQQWLMAAQHDYKVGDEVRAEDRDVRREKRAVTTEIERDERTWKNEQDRAPVKRGIKVADETAAAKGKLDFESENLGRLVENKGALTEAGQTDAQRREAEARAETSEAAAAEIRRGNRRKLDPAMKEQLDALDTDIKAKAKVIDEKRGDPGQWDPDKNPGQKALQTELAAMRLQRAALWRKASADAPTGVSDERPDPQNLVKKPAAGGSKPVGKFASTDEEKDFELTYNNELKKAVGYRDSAKTPEERQRAETDIAAIRREAQRAGVTLREDAPAAAPTTPAAAGMMGPPVPPADIKNAPPGSVVRQGDAYVAPGKAKAAKIPDPLAITIPDEDPTKTAQVDEEIQTAAAQRRPAKFSPELEPYAQKVLALRAKVVEAQRLEAQRKAAERHGKYTEQQAASQQELRDRYAASQRH